MFLSPSLYLSISPARLSADDVDEESLCTRARGERTFYWAISFQTLKPVIAVKKMALEQLNQFSLMTGFRLYAVMLCVGV